MAEVNLQHIEKRFGEVVAVRDVSLQIRDSEFVVLVGPSGCGKSTTLRMVAGLEEVTRGEIFIGSENMTRVHPKDRDIAMVFQSYALYPHMNVRENMSFGLKIRGFKKSEIEARVAEAAQILGLSSLLDRKPKELSGGQRQRVAMGRAIVRKPKLFLFDEPLSNLDAKLRVQMRAEIAKLHQRLGATILYVTHDQVEAMTLADRIVVMEGGSVQQVGAPLEVFEHPRNRFVAGFIGSPSMNFLSCRLEPSGRLRGERFEIEIPQAHRGAVEGRSGEVELGLRPGDVKVGLKDTPSGASAMEAVVEVKEPMGTETYLHLSLAGSLLTVRDAAQSPVKVGDLVRLVPDLGKAHLFDKKSGETLF